LQKLGFEGWAIDFVDAEPAVIAFLNVNCGLHRAVRSGERRSFWHGCGLTDRQ
jgi:hypothetical protein